MNTGWWLLGEVILFCIISFVCKKIRNLHFYYGVLKHTKYPIFDFVVFKEKIVYFITKMVKDVPVFSFAPSDYEICSKENEIKSCCSRIERIWIFISLFFMYVRSVIGNILVDFILVITFLTCEKIINWGKMWATVSKTIINLPLREFGTAMLNFSNWVNSNINFLLILLILLISFYVEFLKRKERKYSIEAVRASEDEERIKRVAKIQKSVETELLEIRGCIYQNLEILQEQIRHYIKEDEIKFDRLVDYESKSDELKTFMWNITEAEGIPIYVQRNRKMYVQLSLMGLHPSISNKKTYIELDCLSKKFIEKSCKSKNELCEVYAYGVGLMNGINRFLKFSYKKKHQYNKLILHITDSSYVGEIFEKVK